MVRVDSLTPIPGLLRDEIERIDDGKNGTAAFAARPRIVISDAIGATSPGLLEASLQALALHTAALLTTEQVIASWRG